MRLLCIADIHGDAAGLRALARAPEISTVDLVIVAGDVTQLGGGNESRAVLGPLLESGVPLLAVGGNMDRAGAREFLAEQKIDLHGRGVIFDGIGFFGLGGGTPSPFGTPWEVPDDEAAECLAAGYADVASVSRLVLVSHPPPRDTDLDRVTAGLHAGAPAVRAFLESHPVELCVCGHIHEGGGQETSLGGCLCVNVGPFRGAGRYALVTLGQGKPTVTWRKR